MPSVETLCAYGFPPIAARNLIDGEINLTQAAAGSTISDATPLGGDTALLTTVGSGTGVRLTDKEGFFVVVNGGANALRVYPHNSSALINNGSAGAHVSVSAGRVGLFFRINALNWGSIYA